MDREFFSQVTGNIPFGGLGAADPLAYRVYDPNRLVLGKRMEDHLRIAVCMWHSFNAPGADMFGSGAWERPWLDGGADPMAAARSKMAAAFEFVSKLGAPFYAFHDRDIAPEGRTFKETQANLDAMVGEAEAHMSRTGVKLLWGRPTCSPIRDTRPAEPPIPIPRSSPLPRPRSSPRWTPPTSSAAPTTSCGAAAKATTRSQYRYGA